MHGLGNLSFNARGFGVSVAPVAAAGARAGAGTATTGAVVAGGFGGTAGYTYAWARVSGEAGIAITSAAAASTTFSYAFTKAGQVSGQFQCTVTDASGLVEKGALVSVSLRAD